MWGDVLGVEDEDRNGRNGRRRCGDDRRCGDAVAGVTDRKRDCNRDRNPVEGIEDILCDILDSVNDIEECTCDTIVGLLRRILAAVEEDEEDDRHRCHKRRD